MGGLGLRWGRIENEIIKKLIVLGCRRYSCEWGEEEEAGIVVYGCDFGCLVRAGHLNKGGILGRMCRQI